MQNSKIILGYIFLITFSLTIAFFFGLQAVSSFLGFLIIYFCLSYTLYIIWKKIRRDYAMGIVDFFCYFLYKLGLYSTIGFILGGSFILTQVHLLPAQMPTHILRSNEKTVVFQGMSHIASQDFYDNVREKIISAKENGYVLYFEGVRPGSSENQEKFNQALGIELTAETYDIMAKLYNFTPQDNEYFLGLVNDEDYNIDISMDEIIQIYESKFPELSSQQEANTSPAINIEEDVLEQLSQLEERELFLLRYFNTALMNFMIKHEGLRTFVLHLIGKEDIFEVILDDRNLHLAEQIQKSEHKKIFVIYGLMHYSGTLEILQNLDGSWKEFSSEYTRVLSAPSF